MKPTNKTNRDSQTPLIVGIDWADGKHDVQVKRKSGDLGLQVEAAPENVEAMITQLQIPSADVP